MCWVVPCWKRLRIFHGTDVTKCPSLISLVFRSRAASFIERHLFLFSSGCFVFVGFAFSVVVVVVVARLV